MKSITTSIMAFNKEFFSEIVGNDMVQDGDIPIGDIYAPTIDRDDMVSWSDEGTTTYVRPWNIVEEDE